MRVAVTVLVTSAGAFDSLTATKLSPSKLPSASFVVTKETSLAPRPISKLTPSILAVAFTGIFAVLPKGIVTIGCSNKRVSGVTILIEHSPTTLPS